VRSFDDGFLDRKNNFRKPFDGYLYRTLCSYCLKKRDGGNRPSTQGESSMTYTPIFVRTEAERLKKILMGTAYHDTVTNAPWGATVKSVALTVMQGWLGGWPISASHLRCARSETVANVLLVDRDGNVRGLFPLKEVLKNLEGKRPIFDPRLGMVFWINDKGRIVSKARQ
jgi:hypothetical protein